MYITVNKATFIVVDTIRIFTNASSGYTTNNGHNKMNGRNGIYIHCVENVAEQYSTIKKMIDDGSPEE